MNTFDAVCHALTTIATGGFSTHQASMGYFQSSYMEYVCVVFMLMSGVNFAMYHFLFHRPFQCDSPKTRSCVGIAADLGVAC